VAAGTKIDVPHEYYPGNDPAKPPLNRWRSHAHLLFGNWINQVYQTTPYDMEGIGGGPSLSPPVQRSSSGKYGSE
jgi:homoserine O-succinyltransferase